MVFGLCRKHQRKVSRHRTSHYFVYYVRRYSQRYQRKPPYRYVPFCKLKKMSLPGYSNINNVFSNIDFSLLFRNEIHMYHLFHLGLVGKMTISASLRDSFSEGFGTSAFRDFWSTLFLRHPSIDTHLESLCSKFPLAMILRWRDIRNNMNYTSPLNTVL